MSNDITKNNQNLPATIYKPSELLGMFTAYLSRQDVNSQVIYLRGIYLKNPKHDPRWTFRYDVLRDEDTQTEITLQMTQKQSDELKDIRKVTDSFDIVMFPIDGRIGNGYTLGGRQFIERFKVGMFVPMHFVASGFESSWRMKEFTDEKGISFWEITKEGETIEI